MAYCGIYSCHYNALLASAAATTATAPKIERTKKKSCYIFFFVFNVFISIESLALLFYYLLLLFIFLRLSYNQSKCFSANAPIFRFFLETTILLIINSILFEEAKLSGTSGIRPPTQRF